jgi:hypothetical protein
MNPLSLFIKQNNINDIDELIKSLYKNNIFTKKYDDLTLIYQKFNISSNNDLQKFCRSLIIDNNTLNIISYSCNDPYLNDEGLYLFKNKKYSVFKSYEGTLLNLFNHNNKWYLSTRKCLDSKTSVYLNISHYDLFLDVLNISDLDLFTSKLDINYIYNFILIHHENIHNIDYSYLFGNNYKKLCLISVLDKNLNYLDNDKYNHLLNDTIFESEKETLENFYNNINCDNNEGIIIKLENEFTLIKLQYNNYILKNLKNNYHKSLFLYQKNILKSCKDDLHIKNVINMTNQFFFTITNELLYLFESLYDDDKNKNSELYSSLPVEYKNILYVIRGIYFKNKKTINYYNIYNLLKHYNIHKLINLCISRKKLQNNIFEKLKFDYKIFNLFLFSL